MSGRYPNLILDPLTLVLTVALALNQALNPYPHPSPSPMPLTLIRFDARQVALSGRVQRLQITLHEAPANASASACHGIAVRELSRHRLVVPEHSPLCKTTMSMTG